MIGTGGNLPFRSAVFDLILCTQVAEHDPDPAATVREAHRALREGGILILSAPGVWFKHGDEDYWRWTDDGLRRLLRPFRQVTIHCCGGQYGALFQILNLYADALPVGRRFAYLMNNLFGLALDRILPSANLIVNFAAVGVK